MQTALVIQQQHVKVQGNRGDNFGCICSMLSHCFHWTLKCGNATRLVNKKGCSNAVQCSCWDPIYCRSSVLEKRKRNQEKMSEGRNEDLKKRKRWTREGEEHMEERDCENRVTFRGEKWEDDEEERNGRGRKRSVEWKEEDERDGSKTLANKVNRINIMTACITLRFMRL